FWGFSGKLACLNFAEHNEELLLRRSVTCIEVSATHDENFLPGYPFVHYPVARITRHIFVQLWMINGDLYVGHFKQTKTNPTARHRKRKKKKYKEEYYKTKKDSMNINQIMDKDT
uniref:Uncharacterized protein n=1 Tax=Romanomermis culicivorax TaxID=13658 RepID=A0A915ISA3_ROMCU